MFVTQYEDRQMALKPMNCPGHAQLYSLQRRSYRDLPRALSEPGLLHRREAERHAARAACGCGTSPRTTLTSSAPRTRSRRRSPRCSEFAFATYDVFGIDVRLELSTRRPRSGRHDEIWDRSEQALAARWSRAKYDLNEGDGAFYGPKIDFAHHRLAGPLVAAAAPCSSTSTCRSASI